MKKQLRISLFAISIVFSLKSFGQITISGKVYSTDSLEIQQASVVLTDIAESQVIDYTFTDINEFYKLKSTKIGKFNLKFSHIGYSTKSIDFGIVANEYEKKIDAFLLEKTMDLNEVIIQFERPFSIKKDTINFKTKYFIDGTEQTVEQLLQKIPGLQIDSDGTIKVGNQEIEKLMVDGEDLFERGYKILSKNMPAYPIEEVEVLKNFLTTGCLKVLRKVKRSL
ncbi:carboxypeptidase-like regulatory domain-containing protein [Nitritalea halalkaliphila]|uniref:carboxypeptidase-like regulatory domain-containing protein n=1 Tax=Nitritalea halalkaliphila TaxID=590849 RepID=UPI001930B831|nr:carboxypeptidase-like regulatory domain-containing protein [Nitritalea halalkaliphila]